MHSKGQNIKIMNIDEVDKVVKDLYDSLKTDNKIIWNQ